MRISPTLKYWLEEDAVIYIISKLVDTKKSYFKKTILFKTIRISNNTRPHNMMANHDAGYFLFEFVVCVLKYKILT